MLSEKLEPYMYFKILVINHIVSKEKNGRRICRKKVPYQKQPMFCIKDTNLN